MIPQIFFNLTPLFLFSNLLLSISMVVSSAIPVPTCQTVAAPSQTPLNGVHSTYLNLSSLPFGIAYATQEKHTAFVALEKALGVLNTSTSPPTLSHQIPLPAAYVNVSGAEGLTLTPSGKYVVVCSYVGALIVDAAKAAAGDIKGAVVGALNGTTNSGTAAIQATVTSDNKYAFISQEYGSNATNNRGAIEVFQFHESSAANQNIVPASYIGKLVLDLAVTGTALSPDGRTLYATSELSSEGSVEGTLSIIDIATLIKHPAQALLGNVTAGCQPVRVIASADGATVWVTARGSNALLAFDAKALLSSSSRASALIASIGVGTSPVGLTFVRNETRILTADSNRFHIAGATTGLSVIDVEAVLKKKTTRAVLGRVPTGLFPREFTVSPDRETVLITDFSSEQVQEIQVSSLP